MLNQLTELQKNLSENRFEFCTKHLTSKKKIVYFAYGMLQRNYIFNTFNIWYALNNYSNSLNCIIGGIGSSDSNINNEEIIIQEKLQNGENSILPKELDYLVLPFVNFDLKDIISKIRKQNKDVKILYQIDFDFTSIATKNKDLKTYEANKEIIFANMKMCDKVVFNSEFLYESFFKNHLAVLEGCGTNATYIPPLFNLEILKSISGSKLAKQKEDPKRIGIICTKENGDDLFYFKKVWLAINKKYKDKVSFQLIGDKNNQIGKSFSSVKTEFTQQTGINSYYNEIFNLNLDCVIVPSKNNEWNNSNYDLNRILELQALGIPVLVSKISPLKKIIVDEKNGFLCEDRDRMIRQLNIICDLDNSSDSHNILTKVSKTAFQHIEEAFNLSNDTNIEHLEDIFFKWK